jgi:hypothetical protein
MCVTSNVIKKLVIDVHKSFSNICEMCWMSIKIILSDIVI